MPSVSNAIRDADAAEAGGGHKEPAMRVQLRIDALHQFAVADFLLGARAIPSVHTRHNRQTADAENLREVAERGADQLGIRSGEDVGIACASEKRTQERLTFWCAMWPLR
jgi:hypothetical protein